MYKLIMKIRRPNGDIESIDVTSKIGFCQGSFDGAKKGTKQAGRGDVIELRRFTTVSNINALMSDYNRFNNEGGEGFVPDVKYFKNLPEYKESTEESVIK